MGFSAKLRPRSDDDVKRAPENIAGARFLGRGAASRGKQAAREASGGRNGLCGDEAEPAGS